MTNTGTGKEGNARQPKRYTLVSLRDWLLQNFRDLAEWRRGQIQEETKAACKAWFVRGGGDGEEFEKLFNGERLEK